MGRLEVSCRRFAILSGVEQEAGDYAICVHPGAPSLQRKGTIALITEPAGDHPSLAVEACRLAQQVVIETYFADTSLSLTSSLLNALDHANTALLQYNYSSGTDHGGPGGEIDAQSSGSRTRRARVGATALLIRPDGEGIYLSQMAPTQAYVYHNGMLSAVPEPAAWRPASQRVVAALSSYGIFSEAAEDEEGLDDLSDATLPAPSLGSGPGIEADLIYRRIAPGDILLLVSSSLARHLDRERAEHIVARNDADGVLAALHSIAVDNGLAQAHACVLEVGVSASSGVDEDYRTELKQQVGKQVADNGGVTAAPENLHQPSSPAIREMFRGPRNWLQRRAGAATEQNDAVEGPSQEAVDEEQDDEASFWSQQPTQRFPRRPIDIPPFKANQQKAIEDVAGLQDETAGEELQFDGWEDSPPALDSAEYDASHKIIFKPKSYGNADEGAWTGDAEQSEITPGGPAPGWAIHQIGLGANEELVGGSNREIAARSDLRGKAGAAGGWIMNTARALLPEQVAARGGGIEGRQTARVLPLRVVIGAALLVAGLLLIYSVLSMANNSQKNASKSLLQEAQQMETLANQPGTADIERAQKLQLALDKAQEAVKATPDSSEAKLLVTKLQGEVDQVEGITRFATVKSLFDLDALDKAASSSTASAAVGSAPQGTGAQETISATVPLPLNGIIVQGNDAYILDRTTSRVYRCQIAAGTCSAVLHTGDSAGGAQVGKIVAMAMRVGSLVVVDDKMVSYILSADTGAWQAEPLGNASSLQEPKDIATYDGNIYLLEAKPGQISKYASGQYGQPPTDWIKDGATVDAMKSPVAMAIDGVIYIALADGKILTMQAGKLDKTITPKAIPGQGTPSALFTNTDVKDLYLLRPEDGTITRISKEGQTLATLRAPAGTGLDKLSGMTVDEARGKYYLVQGRKVYEATLTTPVPGANLPRPVSGSADTVQTQGQQAGLSVRPTVEP